MKFFSVSRSLESLNLNENRLEVVRFPTDKPTTKTSLFANLRQLHISRNNISDVIIIVVLMFL